MSTDFIITEISYGGNKYLAAACYEDECLALLMVEPSFKKSLVGNIYLGAVDSISANIGSAFINIGRKDLCFLTLGKEKLTPSVPVIIEVTKDASAGKQPCCTRKLTIAGKYAVISDGAEGLSFSAKLSGEQKELLKKWVEPEVTKGFHFLIRTNAAWTDKASLNNELKELKSTLEEVRIHAGNAKRFSLLYSPEPFYLRMLRDLHTAPDRILTDIPEIANKTSGTVYENRNFPLAERVGLNRDIEKLLQKVVWLKCGGFIIIEQTQAFVTIDVNTGKCVKGKIAEETYRKVNLEAAAEVSRQILLRGLSGSILVDFINMTNPDHREELINVMKKLVKKDRVHTEVIDLTKLGILEIVRQKTEPPLAETLGYS